MKRRATCLNSVSIRRGASCQLAHPQSDAAEAGSFGYGSKVLKPLLVSLALLPSLAQADIVRLEAGGEVRGVIVDPADDNTPSETITVETLTGGKVTLSRADVSFITRRPRLLEEHDVKAAKAANTVEAQWELAEWCLANNLDEQRNEHLRRVVEIEPEHAAARAALGQKNYDGVWMTREELMESRGLVEHKGKWITPQELELIEKTDAERGREQAWFSQVRKLKGWLRANSDDLRRQSLQQFRQLRDPDAVPALAKFLRDDPDMSVRLLYVGVLAEMPGPKPVAALVTQALHDVDREVRDTAFEAITPPRYDAALPYLLQGLRNPQNVVVRRAGRGLEQIGDERAIPDLIKALITAHKHSIRVPENVPTYTFNTNGTYGAGGIPLPPEIAIGLQTGAFPNGVIVNDLSRPPVTFRTVTINVAEENPEVLSALEKITGESFGFDERTWSLWWKAKKNGAG
jgi:hypothetical protein